MQQGPIIAESGKVDLTQSCVLAKSCPFACGFEITQDSVHSVSSEINAANDLRAKCHLRLFGGVGPNLEGETEGLRSTCTCLLAVCLFSAGFSSGRHLLSKARE